MTFWSKPRLGEGAGYVEIWDKNFPGRKTDEDKDLSEEPTGLSEKQKDGQWNLKLRSALSKMEDGSRQNLRGRQGQIVAGLLSHGEGLGLQTM